MVLLTAFVLRPSTSAGSAGLRSGRTGSHPTELLNGGKGGIRTLEPGCPSYWFSKPAPSASRPPFLATSVLPPGGGGRIRTFGGREPSAVFKTAALNRSATPPNPSNPVPQPALRDASIYGRRAEGSRGYSGGRSSPGSRAAGGGAAPSPWPSPPVGERGSGPESAQRKCL